MSDLYRIFHACYLYMAVFRSPSGCVAIRYVLPVLGMTQWSEQVMRKCVYSKWLDRGQHSWRRDEYSNWPNNGQHRTGGGVWNLWTLSESLDLVNFTAHGRSTVATRCQFSSTKVINILTVVGQLRWQSSHCRRRNHGWKVWGDLAWCGCRSPSFSSSVRFLSPVISPPIFLPILFFLSRLKFS